MVGNVYNLFGYVLDDKMRFFFLICLNYVTIDVY